MYIYHFRANNLLASRAKHTVWEIFNSEIKA